MDDDSGSPQICPNDDFALETSSVPVCDMANDGPITRLPVEILSEIFCIVREKVFPYSWDTMLQVCTHWRAVALGNPQSWRCISNAESPATVNRDLSYCRDLPLEVVIFSDHTDISSFLKSLDPHRHRVESLEAFLLHRADLSALSTVSFPNVHYVSFAATYLNSNSLAFSCSLFPSAENIQLMDVDVTLHTGSTLNRLAMFSIANNGGSSLPSLENLISVLQAAPVLRVLRLQGTWPHPTEDIEVLRGMLPTEMPYMKTAIFRTELAFTREFLSVVSFPDPSRVLLQMSIPAGETRIPTKAGRNIFSYALPDRVFFHNVGRQSEINGVFVTLDSVAGFSLVPGPLAFEVDTGSNPHDHTSLFWRDIVCAFADAMRHGRLGLNEHCAVLSLRGDENHALDLMPLLLALPNLEFIEVEGRYLFTLLDALGGVNLFSERDDVIVCPVLKRLRVRDLFVDDGVVAKLAECFHMRRECSGSEMRMNRPSHGEPDFSADTERQHCRYK